jgi:5'-3' exonuclease
MGVPQLFAYFYRRYSKCIKFLKFRSGADNRNGKFDCLYLDFNGILHTCSHHAQKLLQPKSENEIFEQVMLFIDFLIELIQPTKLLYIAFDGVCPRAKMNEQRKRRFQSDKERDKDVRNSIQILSEMEADGWSVPQSSSTEKNQNISSSSFISLPNSISTNYTQFIPTFLSNCITPQTLFMENCFNYIYSSLFKKKELLNEKNENSNLENDNDSNSSSILRELYSKLTIIISPSSVVGEGEKKIIEFIKNQQSQPNYNINLTHCIYGQVLFVYYYYYYYYYCL